MGDWLTILAMMVSARLLSISLIFLLMKFVFGIFKEFLESLLTKTRSFPDQEDLSGAAIALLRLQDTYALSTDKVARGDIQGVKNSPTMTGNFSKLTSVHLGHLIFQPTQQICGTGNPFGLRS